MPLPELRVIERHRAAQDARLRDYQRRFEQEQEHVGYLDSELNEMREKLAESEGRIRELSAEVERWKGRAESETRRCDLNFEYSDQFKERLRVAVRERDALTEKLHASESRVKALEPVFGAAVHLANGRPFTSGKRLESLYAAIDALPKEGLPELRPREELLGPTRNIHSGDHADKKEEK